MFFADAIILVEGDAEDVLLPYYISQNEKLSKRFITILNIDGAHAFVYNNLLKLLGIPVLIITDLDIKRDDTEKENFLQVDNLDHRETTNRTLAYYNSDSCELVNEMTYLNDDNVMVVFQCKENGFYPTSFEEAVILANYDNELINGVLKNVKPKIYSEIVGDDIINNKNYSFKWQCKLASSKTKFANELLFRMLTSNDDFELPKYIKDGLEYLESSTERG